MLQTAFWLALLLLAYAFIGYPALMALWARIRPRPLRPQPWAPRVALVIVAHNEAQRIRAKLQTCLAQDYAPHLLRVVVACDGASDGTAAIVGQAAEARVTLLNFAQRRGKAACLNDAVAACDEEVIVFTDARQMLNVQAVSSLVHSLSDPKVGVVSGELVFASAAVRDFGQGVDAYWRYEKFIRRNEAEVHSVPGATGALYALRRSAFRAIAPQTILDDVAIPMQACMAGQRVIFDGRAIAFDEPSQAAAAERRRKVRTLAGNFQLVALMPSLLLPWRNPIWLQYVSHKLLRLLAPWAMLALLLSTALLATQGSAFFQAALLAQALFYALPLAAWLRPGWRSWKPARVVQAFVALNGFAVLGLWEFLTNRQAHLWSAGAAAPPEHNRS